MKFTHINDYYLQSDCKGYTVAKVFVRQVARYEAWRGKQLLGVFVNADLAKAACERDARAETVEKAA